MSHDGLARFVVRLFAAARQLTNQDRVELTLPATTTVAELRLALMAAHPSLAPLLPYTRFAVNAQYVADDTLVQPSDEIACIPPVSGG